MVGESALERARTALALGGASDVDAEAIGERRVDDAGAGSSIQEKWQRIPARRPDVEHHQAVLASKGVLFDQ
jgi:hypothetical protein